ncbi:hypothetical protein CDIK_1934 [Cucumispora dikerogammari]|nr:hypothetical protein CDIK_1934 [Cucumispora dikerogammari]
MQLKTEFSRNGIVSQRKHLVYTTKYETDSEIIYELTKEKGEKIYISSDLDMPIRDYFDCEDFRTSVNNELYSPVLCEDVVMDDKETTKVVMETKLVDKLETKIKSDKTIKKKQIGKQGSMLSFLIKK